MLDDKTRPHRDWKTTFHQAMGPSSMRALACTGTCSIGVIGGVGVGTTIGGLEGAPLEFFVSSSFPHQDIPRARNAPRVACLALFEEEAFSCHWGIKELGKWDVVFMRKRKMLFFRNQEYRTIDEKQELSKIIHSMTERKIWVSLPSLYSGVAFTQNIFSYDG